MVVSTNPISLNKNLEQEKLQSKLKQYYSTLDDIILQQYYSTLVLRVLNIPKGRLEAEKKRKKKTDNATATKEKKINNDIHNTTQYTKDGATGISQKKPATWVEFRSSGRVSSSCSSSDTSCVNNSNSISKANSLAQFIEHKKRIRHMTLEIKCLILVSSVRHQYNNNILYQYDISQRQYDNCIQYHNDSLHQFDNSWYQYNISLLKKYVQFLNNLYNITWFRAVYA